MKAFIYSPHCPFSEWTPWHRKPQCPELALCVGAVSPWPTLKSFILLDLTFGPGYWGMGRLPSSACKISIRRFVITEKAPTRAFSWLKAATTAFTFKTLLRLRHYAKRASLIVKLGPRRKGRAAIRHYAKQTAHPFWPLHRHPNFNLLTVG